MYNLEVKPGNKNNPDTAMVNIEGELNLYSAEKIKAKLIEAMKDFKELDIHVRNVEEIDISFLQLLVSMSKAMKTGGKKLSINMEVDDEMQGLLQRSGFNNLKEYIKINN